ncbi:MAG TPA: hypothetical protein VLY63_04955 [Anaerolineae bacterium]|nr:hypothetical protein [Anaerolineae bacterium]
MSRKLGWFMLLVMLALLLAACGPEMDTPTPGDEVAETSPSPTTAPATEAVEVQPSASAEQKPLPVDADDWHVLGSPDAAVTIIEYSDFQ